MAQEIEHRFLLAAMPDTETDPTLIAQGYLLTDRNKTVRIRIADEKGFLTIKGPKVDGAGAEFEYEIPYADAALIIKTMCNPESVLSKNRYEKPIADGLVGEIDQFRERHEGLIIAEVELPARDTFYKKPDWLKNGVDITNDFRFANAVLAGTSRAEMIENMKSVLEPAGYKVNLKP